MLPACANGAKRTRLTTNKDVKTIAVLTLSSTKNAGNSFSNRAKYAALKNRKCTIQTTQGRFWSNGSAVRVTLRTIATTERASLKLVGAAAHGWPTHGILDAQTAIQLRDHARQLR